MFHKDKDPITRAGLGIIGTIGVVLILIAGWSTFAPLTDGEPDSETVAGADDGAPVGPLPQVGEGEGRESVHEDIETADEELAVASEGEINELSGTAEPPEGGVDEAGEAPFVEGTEVAEAPVAESEEIAEAPAAEDDALAFAEGEAAEAPVSEVDETAAPADAPPPLEADETAAPADAPPPLEVDQEGAAAGGEAQFSEEGMALLAADAEAGARVWNQCRACHVADEEQNRVGPHLVDIIGREVASVEGFRYSDALQNLETEHWTPEELDAWLADPRGYAPGTTMSFSGLRKPEDRANLLTWLYEMQQGQ